MLFCSIHLFCYRENDCIRAPGETIRFNSRAIRSNITSRYEFLLRSCIERSSGISYWESPDLTPYWLTWFESFDCHLSEPIVGIDTQSVLTHIKIASLHSKCTPKPINVLGQFPSISNCSEKKGDLCSSCGAIMNTRTRHSTASDSTLPMYASTLYCAQRPSRVNYKSTFYSVE